MTNNTTESSNIPEIPLVTNHRLELMFKGDNFRILYLKFPKEKKTIILSATTGRQLVFGKCLSSRGFVDVISVCVSVRFTDSFRFVCNTVNWGVRKKKKKTLLLIQTGTYCTKPWGRLCVRFCSLEKKKKPKLGLYSFPCSEVLVSVEVCWINLPKWGYVVQHCFQLQINTCKQN